MQAAAPGAHSATQQTFNTNTTHNKTPPEYELLALEAAVPGLEELPESLPLDRKALAECIKANFRRHRGGVTELAEGYTALDQGFAALRAIPRQLYLQACSSRAEEAGVQVRVRGRRGKSLPECTHLCQNG